MSNRFHNKWHRVSHFTFKKPNVLDAGWDPIASNESPFLGNFILSPEASSYGDPNPPDDDWSMSARRGDFLNLYSWGGNDRITVHSNLYVDNNLYVHENATVTGYGNIIGDISGHSNLYITGNETIGGYSETYGDITGHSNLYITGSGAMGGDLDVYGNITGHKNLNLSGNETIAGYSETYGNISGHSNLYITGSGAVGKDLDVYGNITGHKNLNISGHTQVSGNTILGGYLDVYGNITGHKNLNISGHEQVSGNSTVGGYLDVYGNITGHKNLTISGNEVVSGTSTVYKSLYVGGNITGYSNLFISGNETVSGTSYVSGSGRIGKTLMVASSISGYDNLYIASSTNIGKDLTVSGNAGISGYENVKEYSHVYGEDENGYGLLVDKNAIVSGSTEIGKSNSAISDMSMAVGSGSYAGLKAYNYTNTGNVTNSLTFSATPDWAVNDVVSIINRNKYPDAVTISAINGNVVTFSTNLPFTSIIEESDFDSKCAYVISKPDKGNIDLGIGAVAEGSGASALNFVSHAEGCGTSAFGQYGHAEGKKTKAMYCAHSEGASAKATGEYSHAEGVSSESIGSRSHAEGTATSAFGYSSHAEGGETEARGRYSHTEGYKTIAYPANDDLSGHGTHAEGVQTQAGVGAVVTNFSSGLNGIGAHAEGGGTAAAGRVSHAEGLRTYASGIATHAEGLGTIAQNDAEHAEGQYNKSNKTTIGTAVQKKAGSTIHSVGIGTSSADNNRANAFEIMQNGDIYMYMVGGYLGRNSVEPNKAKHVAWVINDLTESTNNKIDSMIEVTWEQLSDMVEDEVLRPGQQYRITDYEATVANDGNARAVSHPFDIIVVADSFNKLNEKARAIQHDEDTYFNGCRLETWQIWYCLDNDASRFNWAAATGKGVIYRMIDEWGNDVPYDFKGIQFKAYGDTNNVWRYTFDSGADTGNIDYSINGGDNYVDHNVIRAYIDGTQRLNQIVFKGGDCFDNTFGRECYSNTFKGGCYSNTFKSYCYNNIFGSYCYSNTFNNGCYGNVFGRDCNCNTFQDSCYSNVIGEYCGFIVFGNDCHYNIFGGYCTDIIFGQGCSYNVFGNRCHHITFGNDCFTNTFGHLWSDFSSSASYAVGDYVKYSEKFYRCTAVHTGAPWNGSHFTEELPALSYYQYITFEQGVRDVVLECTATRGDGGMYYQYVTVESSVCGTPQSLKHIPDSNVNQTSKTAYQAVGSQTINV